MVTPEIRRLQVLNDLIAQTLDVINQRSIWAGGLSHSPYTQELGIPQVNPFLTQYGVPQTGVGQVATAQGTPYGFQFPQGVPYAPQGLMHTPFTAGGPQGVGLGQQGFVGAQGLGFGPQPFSQIAQGVPYGSPWSQGLMHSPFASMGYGQQGLGFGQQPFGQISQALPYASPWSTIGRFSGVPPFAQSF